MPVTFRIHNDRVQESFENFVIVLASVDDSIVGQSGTMVTIEDDDCRLPLLIIGPSCNWLYRSLC